MAIIYQLLPTIERTLAVLGGLFPEMKRMNQLAVSLYDSRDEAKVAKCYLLDEFDEFGLN